MVTHPAADFVFVDVLDHSCFIKTSVLRLQCSKRGIIIINALTLGLQAGFEHWKCCTIVVLFPVGLTTVLCCFRGGP